MKPWMSKLRQMAETIAMEKPILHFMGLVPHQDLPDRWHLLVSSDQLKPHAMEGLRYIASLLKKHMSAKDRVKVSLMVILPHDRATIKALNQPGDFTADRLQGLYRFDAPDEVIVLWPMKRASAFAQTG